MKTLCVATMNLAAQRPSAQAPDGREYHLSPVQNRDREKIEDRKVHVDEDRDPQDCTYPDLCGLVEDVHDADRPGDLGQADVRPRIDEAPHRADHLHERQRDLRKG